MYCVHGPYTETEFFNDFNLAYDYLSVVLWTDALAAMFSDEFDYDNGANHE